MRRSWRPAFYILHSPDDFITMGFPQNAERWPKATGVETTLKTYEGSHGWHGDVLGTIGERAERSEGEVGE